MWLHCIFPAYTGSVGAVSHLMRIFAWHRAFTSACRQERRSPIYCILTSSLPAHQAARPGPPSSNCRLLGGRPAQSEAQGLGGC